MIIHNQFKIFSLTRIEITTIGIRGRITNLYTTAPLVKSGKSCIYCKQNVLLSMGVWFGLWIWLLFIFIHDHSEKNFIKVFKLKQNITYESLLMSYFYMNILGIKSIKKFETRQNIVYENLDFSHRIHTMNQRKIN